MAAHRPVLQALPRRVAGRIARRLARRFGLEIVRVGADPSVIGATLVPEEHFEVVPRGRTEPFRTSEYDVVPQRRFDIVRRDYNSPVPDLTLLPPDIWTRRSRLARVELDLEASMSLLEGRLAPRVAELEVPMDATGEPGVFHLHNQAYEGVDAELLYAMIRDLGRGGWWSSGPAIPRC